MGWQLWQCLQHITENQQYPGGPENISVASVQHESPTVSCRHIMLSKPTLYVQLKWFHRGRTVSRSAAVYYCPGLSWYNQTVSPFQSTWTERGISIPQLTEHPEKLLPIQAWDYKYKNSHIQIFRHKETNTRIHKCTLIHRKCTHTRYRVHKHPMWKNL